MSKRIPPYTQMTLKLLRKDDVFSIVEVVEHRVPVHGQPFGITRDLFGIIDIVCLEPGRTVAVQSTSVGALSAHKKKLTESENTRKVLEAGWEIWLIAWEKKGNRWQHRKLQFQLPDEEVS